MNIAVSATRDALDSLGTAVNAAMGFPTPDGSTLRYALVMKHPTKDLYGYCAEDPIALQLAESAGLSIEVWDETWEGATEV